MTSQVVSVGRLQGPHRDRSHLRARLAEDLVDRAFGGFLDGAAVSGREGDVLECGDGGAYTDASDGLDCLCSAAFDGAFALDLRGSP